MTKPDLDSALESHLGHFASVVLLSGLALNRASLEKRQMNWIGLGPNGPEEVTSETLAQLISAGIAGGRVISDQAPQIWAVLPRSPGPILQLKWQELQNRAFQALPSGYQLPAIRLLYVVGAAQYHLCKLIELYNDVPLRCLSDSAAQNFRDDRVVLSGQVEPYFEIEALISVAVRVFETSRYPLWQCFGRNSACPRNFEKALRGLEMPDSLKAWRQKWSDYYVRLRQYRDCFHHNAHFGARLPFAMGVRIDSYWGLSVRLPDNPESKSYDAFTYDEDIDSLNYGWSLLNSIFDFTVQTFEAIGEQVQTTNRPTA